jgi:hypothetical protein
VGRVNESHPRLPATVIIFTLIIITPSPAENPLVAYQPNPKIQDYSHNHELSAPIIIIASVTQSGYD